jgi:Peptidase C13 family
VGTAVALVLGLLFCAAVFGDRILRSRTPFRLARRQLRDGNPRRSRALGRLQARRNGEEERPWLELHEANALFWEGQFARALRVLDARVVAVDDGELGVLPTILRIECLLFDERTAEASGVFEAARASLEQSPIGHQDLAVIRAWLRFFEGDTEGARTELETVRTAPDEKNPVVRLAHLCAAAIACRADRKEEARHHLAAAIVGGGTLFVARWAQSQWEKMFPSEPAPPREARARAARPRRGIGRILFAGAHVLALRPSIVAGGTSFTADQVAALALFDASFALLLRCIDYAPGAYFFAWGMLMTAAPVLLFPLTALVVATPARSRADATLRIMGGFYAALPPLLALAFVAARTSPPSVSSHVVLFFAAAWSLAMMIRLARAVVPGISVARSLASTVLFIGTWLLPMGPGIDARLFYSPVIERAPASERERAPSAREREVEMFAELERVHAAEASLAQHRPGTTDLYFVGVAGYAAQDVFAREALAARALVDERFDTRGRSILLLNAPTSLRETLPLASLVGLRHALASVASRMDVAEDVLFLFMTSHGSSRGLALQFPRGAPFDDDTLAPTELRTMLEQANIKWRVLVLAGCQSGVFLDELKTDFSALVTAAAGDRFSYGCANGRAFTDFGRVVFDDELPKAHAFLPAFRAAIARTEKREADQGLRASSPQLFEGTAIGPKLRELEARFSTTGGDSR